jgi:hypothetical protein
MRLLGRRDREALAGPDVGLHRARRLSNWAVEQDSRLELVAEERKEGERSARALLAAYWRGEDGHGLRRALLAGRLLAIHDAASGEDSAVSRLSLFSNERHLLSDIHMDASLHRRTLGAVALRPRRRPVVAVGAAAVPGAAGVGASDDLEQLARVDVTDLDKVPREEQEPRRVEGDRLGDRLPLDRLVAARRLAVLLDVKAEG